MLVTSAQGLALLRESYQEHRDLLRIVLNATSIVEANMALGLLVDRIPEKALVTAVNLREAFKELPTSPFAMAVDQETLVRVAELVPDGNAHARPLGAVPDGDRLVVITAGNLCLDVVVATDGHSHFWSPVPVTDDYINPELLDRAVCDDSLLEGVVGLVTSMGLAFNPRFYLSLEDWQSEYAKDTVSGMDDLF